MAHGPGQPPPARVGDLDLSDGCAFLGGPVDGQHLQVVGEGDGRGGHLDLRRRRGSLVVVVVVVGTVAPGRLPVFNFSTRTLSALGEL